MDVDHCRREVAKASAECCVAGYDLVSDVWADVVGCAIAWAGAEPDNGRAVTECCELTCEDAPRLLHAAESEVGYDLNYPHN
jgi:hypothetical protein